MDLVCPECDENKFWLSIEGGQVIAQCYKCTAERIVGDRLEVFA